MNWPVCWTQLLSPQSNYSASHGRRGFCILLCQRDLLQGKKHVNKNFPFPLRLPIAMPVSGKMHFLWEQNKSTHTFQGGHCVSVRCLLSRDTDLHSLWSKGWIVKLWIWATIKLLWGYILWDFQLIEAHIAHWGRYASFVLLECMNIFQFWLKKISLYIVLEQYAHARWAYTWQPWTVCTVSVHIIVINI